ncbi:excinuclease ABC subunit UvrA [Clostridium sporogenes]|uniref:excinuclease ABC subunit UvrA n=1 Tax=Clostridium sporogenes TaxID=1509 RepID=UPI0022388917|nr:excinuclease ABC subunit UvrA [Clostridium sporogenes]MCW6109114.1 excinuclease ABC subunit UvrA [Clostridium sporogenes]
MDEIKIVGARVHNLKNINVNIPKGNMIVITGVSGSGKSSLAFDVIFDEGINRYLQSVGFPPKFNEEKPFDLIEGLSPTIAIEQRISNVYNPRSTVGTKTGIYNLLRLLYSLEGILICPDCKNPVLDLECESCGMVLERLPIKCFSFNDPSGLCFNCDGRGYTTHFSEESIVKDSSKNLLQITMEGKGSFANQVKYVEQLPNFFNFDINTPYRDLPDDVKNVFLYGSNQELNFRRESKRFSGDLSMTFEGIIPYLERVMSESKSTYRANKITKNYMVTKLCNECHGYRINENARGIKIAGKHIGELAMMTVENLTKFLNSLTSEHIKSSQGRAIVDSLSKSKLKILSDLGLSYIHMNRSLPTLSGGELQRISLMTHLDSGLDSLIYILDEPSMSLHEREKDYLIESIKKLKQLGNTVIIVEHDKRFMEIADRIIDIGPGAGVNGGEVVHNGSISDIKQIGKSHTGQYLSGKATFPKKTEGQRKKINAKTKFLVIKDAKTHNLKEIAVKIPLGMMVGIAGVSGSGKSSLIMDTLVPLLSSRFNKGSTQDKNFKNTINEGEDNSEQIIECSGVIEGYEHIDDLIVVNQSPLSRKRTSMPASFIGIWDMIRNIFANTLDAKERGYDSGHFSYNSEKGYCSSCRGKGIREFQISGMNNFATSCVECKGKRYKSEILEVKYKGKSISDVLDMTVYEAFDFFEGQTGIRKILSILIDIGMGYITLGQPSPTLSGGEAQRIKLAKELGKVRKGNSLYILDEPTVGLSFYDQTKLIDLLNKIVKEGNSVLIIEHNTNVLAYSDYIIELGPNGGPNGGEIIATGLPEEIINNPDSNTGEYLKI